MGTPMASDIIVTLYILIYKLVVRIYNIYININSYLQTRPLTVYISDKPFPYS